MLLEDKKQFIDEFKERLIESQSCILTNYQGLAVNDITELRSKLRKSECAMRVVKNRLAKRALKDIKNDKYEELDSYLSGPTAVLLAGKDPSAAVKIFKEFADKNEFMEFKAGVINDNAVTGEQLLRLADLPSKDAMLGKTVNVMNAPIQGLYTVLSGIIKKLAYVLNDLKDKIEKEGPAEGAEAENNEQKPADTEKKPLAEEEKNQEEDKEKKAKTEVNAGKNGKDSVKEKTETDRSKENTKDESKEKQEGDDGKEEK
ncbi:MAG: 50S ribosomal protein L10 [Elusimicrobia bacterium]|jgi:large subunit ribosomal protein L10|nr:50S ribosomal protein L10 [Elusimicrobiota bacterium]